MSDLTAEKCVRPLLLVVSAPSGAGKTTLCQRLVAEFASLSFSVSCTTRPARAGERNGHDYHFMSPHQFNLKREAGAFLEHARVYDNYYGTLREDVGGAMADGEDVLLDIDTQGAASIRESLSKLEENHIMRRGFVDIFIAPPSIDALRKRLTDRATDDKDTIARRMLTAERELSHHKKYKYLVVNDDLETAYDQIRSIIIAEHRRIL